MGIFNCAKLRKGSLDYRINEEDETIKLVKDHPKHGQKGASFDDSPIAFSTINNVLKDKSFVKACDFTHCFPNHSGNNSSMLAAVLVDLGILAKKGTGFTVKALL